MFGKYKFCKETVIMKFKRQKRIANTKANSKG